MSNSADELWCLIAAIAADFHEDRVQCIAEAIGELKSFDQFEKARHSFGANGEKCADHFKAVWGCATQVSSAEIVAALLASSQAAKLLSSNQNIDLVWTGPKTGLIPVRNTEQVTIEVIESARSKLFLVSYVFYKANSIVAALNSALRNDVEVKILLESSTDEGGAVKVDGLRALSQAVTGAQFYIWNPLVKNPGNKNLGYSVHAKCVVADSTMAFITSANLTSAALERNMELGLLIRGGCVPERLQAHLEALADLEVIKEWAGN